MTTPSMYTVTASALKLRPAPSTAGARLTAIPRGEVVTRLEDPALAPDWYKVSWNGWTGYAASAYLRPVGGAPVGDRTPPQDTDIPPAPPVAERDRDLAKLHPTVRAAVQATLASLQQKGIPFRVFEGYRTPERQNWLYAEGRTRAGRKVTDAQAWQSMHQYGLAADLVLFTNGGWSWDASGDKRGWWTEMQAIAKGHGLTPLSWELPHVELGGSDWRKLQRGELPPDGDETWYEALAFAAERWRLAGRSPYAPPLAIGDRPPLEA